MFKSILSLLIATLLLVGCTSTNITSHTDKAAQAKKYSKIVVYANIDDTQLRDYAETKFIEELKSKSVIVIKSLDIFPVTKEYNAKEVKKKIFSNRIDASLVINVSESGVGSITNLYDTYWGGKVDKLTTNKSWSSFSVILYDTYTGGRIWYLDTKNKETTGYSNLKNVVNSLGKKAVDKLASDDLLNPVSNK